MPHCQAKEGSHLKGFSASSVVDLLPTVMAGCDDSLPIRYTLEAPGKGLSMGECLSQVN